MAVYAAFQIEGMRADMAQRRNWHERMKRIGPMAGALALLFQVMSWAWMGAGMGAGTETAAPLAAASLIAASLTADSRQQLAICTPEGLKPVALAVAGDRAGDPADAPSGPPPTDHDCPLCPLVGGLTTVSPPAQVAPASPGRNAAIALPGDLIAAGWFLSTLQARAPPTVG